MVLFKKMFVLYPLTGYWLIEEEGIFSLCLFKMQGGRINNFPEEALNCYTWVLRGWVVRENEEGELLNTRPSWKPFRLQAKSFDTSSPAWILVLKGPWSKQWKK